MDSSQFDVIDHVFDLLTWVGYRVCLRLFLNLFFIFPSYQQMYIPYILLTCSTLHNIFYVVGLFI
jgi:hypothetical protein